MSRITSVVTLAAALAFGTGAASADEGKKDDPGATICKNQKKTGTRFATKVCFTRKQWEEIAEANKRDYAESRDRRTIDATRDN